jgi:hypothetical protein
MPKMFRRFTANDPRLLTGVGIREQGRIRADGSGAGTILYGPYISLLPGNYEATIRFDPGVMPQGFATFDACADTGRMVLATRMLSAEQLHEQGMSASLAFSCNDIIQRAEIRLRCDSDFMAAIESVEISGEFTPVSGGDGFVISDLPPVDVRNELTRGRNPYEGYRRALGVLASDVMAKITMDPYFQEAFELCRSRTIVRSDKLANIFLLIKHFLRHLPFGNIAEFGSFHGGSAIFMASLAQKCLPNAQVLAFDTFSGMPPTDKAVDRHNAGSFGGVDLPGLRRYVEKIGLHNLHFVQGRFENTAKPVLEEVKNVALCHVDCDIRSALRSAYDMTRPYMVPGGYWVFDDPLEADCLGATEAVEDLLIRRDGLNAEQVWPHLVFRQPFDKKEPFP